MSAISKASALVPPRSLGEAPLTLAERLRAIEQLRDRVNAHVQFMSRIDSLKGTSAEAR